MQIFASAFYNGYEVEVQVTSGGSDELWKKQKYLYHDKQVWIEKWRWLVQKRNEYAWGSGKNAAQLWLRSVIYTRTIIHYR